MKTHSNHGRAYRARHIYPALALWLAGLMALTACTRYVPAATSPVPVAQDATVPAQAGGATRGHGGSGMAGDSSHGTAVTFGLTTTTLDGKPVFRGVGGEIDGVYNPTLKVMEGDLVRVTFVNGDGAAHDLVFPALGIYSEELSGIGAQTQLQFTPVQRGELEYYSSAGGDRKAGMAGKLLVGAGGTGGIAAQGDAPGPYSIVRDPRDLPPPIGNRPPQTVQVNMETVEVVAPLNEGATYRYWTFDGKVPGPFVRVRVNDTVVLRLRNRATSYMPHSIDLHAVTGPGGGAVVTQVPPGEERTLTFTALHPGLFVYHCATPMVADHIASGMYGLILVEPEGGLPSVDKEFYVMQGELYTVEPFGSVGLQQRDPEKLLAEEPEYFLLNGAVGGLTNQRPMRASVGETVRIFFGVGGPNFASSFHVIGEIFDRVYNLGTVTAAPLTDVQTVSVPPGGATIVEFGLQVPGKYILVDHALSRMERGLMGFLMVQGQQNPGTYREEP